MPKIVYRPEIDGLRAIAIISVLGNHAHFYGFSGGFIGVDLFFVISGYLITSIIASEINDGSFSYARFYERRARRLLPALFVTALLSIVVGWHILETEHLVELGKSVITTLGFASNWFFYSRTGYFDLDSALKPLLHTWSLSVEEQFYIFFPFLLILIFKSFRKYLVEILLALAVISLVIAEWTLSRDPSLAFYGVHTRIWEFVAGALVAVSAIHINQTGKVLQQGLSWLGFAAIVGSVFLFDEATRHPGIVTLVPVLGAAAVIAFATSDTPVGKLLAQPIMVGIGLISYSLYLFHQPLFAFYRTYRVEPISQWEYAGLIVCCIFLAAISWRWIEQPARKRKSVPLLPAVGVSTVAVLGLVATGLAIRHYDGFPDRLGPRAATLLKQMDAGWEKRKKGIRLGDCHFGGQPSEFQNFIDGWTCLKDEDAKIVSFGDSHSADKAWALRLANVKIANLGGSGCPLVPNPNTAHCTEMMKHVIKLAKSGKISGIVLASRFENWKAKSDTVAQMFKFWSQANVPVLLFTPMPEFTRIREVVARNALMPGTPFPIRYDEALLKTRTETILSQLPKSGFSIISSRDAFCGQVQRADCAAILGSKPLLLDYGHLSPLGAKRFGRRIVEMADWKRWFEGVNRYTANHPTTTAGMIHAR